MFFFLVSWRHNNTCKCTNKSITVILIQVIHEQYNLDESCKIVMSNHEQIHLKLSHVTSFMAFNNIIT